MGKGRSRPEDILFTGDLMLNGEDFRAWMKRLRLTYREAAEQLGFSEGGIYKLAKADHIRRPVALACERLEYLYHGGK